jgi:hypothetical protein
MVIGVVVTIAFIPILDEGFLVSGTVQIVMTFANVC